MFAHYDSAFVVWSIMTSPELPKIINGMRRSRKDKSDERCLMVQGNDSLEVQSESLLDTVRNIGRVGYDSAESYPTRPPPI